MVTTVLRALNNRLFEPPNDKTDKMACALSEDSDQTGRIRVFSVRMKKAGSLVTH